MFIAIVVDPKLLEIKRKMDKKGDKGSKESKKEIEDEDLDIDEEIIPNYSPLTVLQQTFEEYDNKVEFLVPNEKLLSLLDMGKFDLILNTTDKKVTNYRPAQYIALFDLASIPFVGSQMGAVSLCKNKSLFKSILQLNLIPTPEFHILKIQSGKLPSNKNNLHFPLIIKFFREGIHISEKDDKVVMNKKELDEILEKFVKKVKFSYVMLEEFIKGRKFYLPILGNDLNNNIRFLPALEFSSGVNLDIDKKNKKNPSEEVKTETIHFLDRTNSYIKRARKIAHKAYTFCNCRDYAMAVFLIDEKTDNILLHEINPITNLLPEGKIALAAEHVGINYKELINDIVLNALKRYDMKIRGKYNKLHKEEKT